MMKIALSLLLAAGAAFAQYKVEPAGAPPADLNPAFAALLQKDGVKLAQAGKTLASVWLRTAMPVAPKVPDANVTLPVPQGSFMGVIHFPAAYSDRRGQTIKAGTYTLRFSMFPENGDHQGVAPQRDFFLLVPASEDKDVSAAPGFDELVGWSKKASGTPHPAVLSVWKAEKNVNLGIQQMGEHDWVLQSKIGDTPVAIILVGRAEG